MIEFNQKFVKCVSVTDSFSIMRGDHCMLPLSKARMMESMGAVKILDKLVRPNSSYLADDDYLYRAAFSNRRQTRVMWIQNYNKHGGAEISNYNCVAVGRNLGFDIVGMVVNDLQGKNLLRNADVIIVNNLHSENKDVVVDYLKNTTIPWIKYDHDFLETDFDLFKKSKLNVFISPIHRDFYFEKVGLEIAEKSICLPLAIIPERWEYKSDSRQPDTVFIPSYKKCRKNVVQFIEQHPDKKYIVAGDIKPMSPNIETIGEIDYDKMQEMYHKYDMVLHMPEKMFAGDRILFEATLCGCKVITNENAGHASWTFDWRDHKILRVHLKNALYEFWRHVDRITNGA